MKSCYKLGELIRNVDVKNKDLHCNNLRGLSMTKEFRPSTSNIVGTDLSKYKIVAQKQFACDFMSTIRVHKMPIAFNTGKEEILVSPAYAVFEVVDEKIILPEYLMMWFSRTEFDRYADFRSDAAIRGGFGWNELCETSISIPCITDQYKIVFEYQAITERIALKQKINDNLEAQVSAIYHSMFEERNEWSKGSVSDFGEIVGGATPSKDIDEYFCSDGIVWLTPKDLTSTGNKFIYKGETDITEAAYHSCSTKLLPKGSVLLSSRAPVGCVAIAMTDLCTNQGFKSIIPKSEFGTAFVYYFLKENRQLLESHSSGTTFMEISGNVLKAIPVSIPPEELTKKFSSICEPIFAYQEQIEAEIFQLLELQRTMVSQISSR